MWKNEYIYWARTWSFFFFNTYVCLKSKLNPLAKIVKCSNSQQQQNSTLGHSNILIFHTWYIFRVFRLCGGTKMNSDLYNWIHRSRTCLNTAKTGASSSTRSLWAYILTTFFIKNKSWRNFRTCDFVSNKFLGNIPVYYYNIE